ncbi:MAG: YfiR family protein, partial [Betaproteobacteria bacterium]
VVKAAFLYNFATFAEWPADSLAVEQNLSLCVIGDDAIAEALDQTVKGRAIRGHKVMVEAIKEDGKVRACHLLFASGYDPARTTQLARALKGASVLTVSDGDRFAASGGIAQLYVENERMRFAINTAAADRARIHLSSKLLNLAKMVKDESDDAHR